MVEFTYRSSRVTKKAADCTKEAKTKLLAIAFAQFSSLDKQPKKLQCLFSVCQASYTFMNYICGQQSGTNKIVQATIADYLQKTSTKYQLCE